MDYRWDDVRIFLALHRERTLGGAGAKLKIDASTVSRRLAAFEETLGRPLFERTREGLVPTEAALELLPLAETMEHAGRRFAEHAEDLEGAVEGVVRMTCPPLVAETFVVPLLPALLARHPGLRIDIDASQRRLDLSRGEADLALRDAPQASGDVVVTRLLTLRLALLAAPALAERVGSVRELGALPWITWGDPVAHLGPAEWLRTHAPSVEPVLRSSSLGAQLAAAEAGMGVMVAPRIFLRSHALVALPLVPPLRAQLDAWPPEEIWLAAARTRRAVPRIAATWAYLVERSSEIVALEEG